MIKILFVCHGNICRSTMCEFVMKDMVNKKGISESFYISSAATSREEIGNDIHEGTKQILDTYNIPYTKHHARQIKKEDYEEYDYIIGMDHANISNIKSVMRDDEHKIHLLLAFAQLDQSIADPWYTGDFRLTYRDVSTGCSALLETILKEHKL